MVLLGFVWFVWILRMGNKICWMVFLVFVVYWMVCG